MSGITTGVGLISGLPIQDLIDSLIKAQSRPVDLLKTRIQGIQTQRTAFMDLSARLTSLKGIVTRLGKPTFFEAFKSQSSDESVLTAMTGTGARPGSYQFRVHSLVSNHQLIAGGLADADSTPVGAGVLTVEIGNGMLNPSTELDSLNGGRGVRRGKITITDGTGKTAQIDLTTALTVDDVLDAINSQTTANVRASVSGDRIVIENGSGVTGTLRVEDARGGYTAADLGILGLNDAGRIEGSDVVNLADGTPLTVLNDDNGVRRNRLTTGDFRVTAGGESFVVTLSDFLQPRTRLAQLNSGNGVRMDDGSGDPPGIIRVTNRSGRSAEIDLSSANTVQDVKNRIEAAGLGVTVAITSSRLQIRDTTTPPAEGAVHLKIEDVSGYAARDLGIAGDTDKDAIIGSNIFRVATVGDVIRAIHYAEGNYDDVTGQSKVAARISDDGNGIVLAGNTLGPVTVEAVDMGSGTLSQAAADLGIEGTFASGQAQSRRLIAGLNTVLLHSLNGGAGVPLGAIQTTARDGTTFTHSGFDGAQTVQDVVDRINAQSAQSKVSARINPAGNGIEILDLSGGTGTLNVADAGGTMAAALGIAGSSGTGSLVGRSAQLQYVSGATRLEDMNFGQGVRTGRFRFTNTVGAAFTVNVTENQTTVGDILDLINSQSDVSRVTATINTNGDGILLTDSAGGTETLRVDDVDGGAATDLRIAGEAAADTNFIDGSMEVRVSIDADDTLNDVVTKINETGGVLSASVLNDGSATSPYRLAVSSGISGSRGRMVLDAGVTGLAVQTLVEARDAVISLGDPDAGNPLIIASSTNSVSDVLPGVTLNLLNTSDKPVTLSVSQDLEGIAADLKSFVSTFNDLQDRIGEYTAFDPETETRGVLLGDNVVRRIQDRLYRSAMRRFDTGGGNITRLSDVGITFESGARLTFDEERFRETYADNPRAVEHLFTDEEDGIGAVLEDILDEMTRAGDGILPTNDATLQQRQEDMTGRIETLQTMLDAQRARLERQFQGLETALAQLQQQQTSLNQLSALSARK